MFIRLSQQQRRFSLTALLLLCLSAGVWLQGEHIHLDGSAVHHDCLVCHHGAAAAVSKTQNSPILPRLAVAIAAAMPAAVLASQTRRPPARAPPLSLA